MDLVQKGLDDKFSFKIKISVAVYTEGVDFLMQLTVFEIGVMTHKPGEMFWAIFFVMCTFIW